MKNKACETRPTMGSYGSRNRLTLTLSINDEKKKILPVLAIRQPLMVYLAGTVLIKSH